MNTSYFSLFINRISILFVIALAHIGARGQGLVDTSFYIGAGAQKGFVETIALQMHGDGLACGNFTFFNNNRQSYIVRLHTNGSLDTNFLARPSDWVRHAVVQPDGKILIGGFFRSVNDQPRSCIARLNFNGSLDTSFNPGSGATGTLAVSITGNADPFIFQLCLQADGKILITGNFTAYNGITVNGIARINSDGSFDPTFNVGSGLSTWGRSIQVLPNKQILVTGWFDNYNNSQHNRMALINPDGSPDNSFLPFFGDRTAVYTAVKLTNGQYIVAGHSVNTNGLFREEIRKLNSDGSVDGSFITTADNWIQCLRMQADGKILLCGDFSMINGVRRTKIARIYQDGYLDPSFSAEVNNWAWTTALTLDGKILLSGGFSTVDGFSRSGVVRLFPK